MAIVVVGVIAAIAIPTYRDYVERTRRAKAIRDIAELAMQIEHYDTDHHTYPPNLAALGAGLPTTDPWGRAYQYLPIAVTPAPSPGQVRRDKNMNPLNSDFDLYSMGPDGVTQMQLTASNARDDIVRASNGSYIGLASEH